MTRYGLDKLSLRDHFVDLDALPNLIAQANEHGQPIVFRPEQEPSVQVEALMRALGVPIIVEP